MRLLQTTAAAPSSSQEDPAVSNTFVTGKIRSVTGNEILLDLAQSAAPSRGEGGEGDGDSSRGEGASRPDWNGSRPSGDGSFSRPEGTSGGFSRRAQGENGQTGGKALRRPKERRGFYAARGRKRTHGRIV